jgi:hypothetical protein
MEIGIILIIHIGTNYIFTKQHNNGIKFRWCFIWFLEHNATTTDNPSIAAQTNGKIGINVPNPTANLHIAASTTLSALMRLSKLFSTNKT